MVQLRGRAASAVTTLLTIVEATVRVTASLAAAAPQFPRSNP
jgi:hypothetical protein